MAMSLHELQSQADSLIEQLHSLIVANVPQKGDRSEDCCLLAITGGIQELECLVSDLEEQDLVPDDDWLNTNLLSGFVPSAQLQQEAV